jgi:hypothetical protein
MSLPTRPIRVLLALPVIAMAASWPALAETEAERQACTNDAQVHCADQIPDRDQVYACLVRKVSALSAPCKSIITASIRGNRSRAR